MAQRECFLPLSSRMALAMLKGAGISGGKPVSCTLELDTSALPILVVKFAVLPDELAAVLAELGALREVGERAEAGRSIAGERCASADAALQAAVETRAGTAQGEPAASRGPLPQPSPLLRCERPLADDGENMGCSTVTPLGQEFAALAADFYRAAGTHIAAPCPELQVASGGQVAALAWLGAASAVRGVLLRSAAGRKALADLGCQVVLHQVEGE